MMIEKGTCFTVLDKGEIRFIDYMGSDADICEAARVSYGAGTKSVSDNRQLIRYLMRHQHTSPFEQCELKLYIKLPMDCMRQLVRHRTASLNEYSTRYSEAIDEKQETNSQEWRRQSGTNKQGSGEFLETNVGEALSTQERVFHNHAEQVYKNRLEVGVAREQARKDLPLSTYTIIFWKIDLHNLLHFLRLRMDSHAQLEIRSYANIIGNEIVSQLWPITWESFVDYRLQAINLTRLDIEVIKLINENVLTNEAIFNNVFTNKREREECEFKLTQLGILLPEAI